MKKSNSLFGSFSGLFFIVTLVAGLLFMFTGCNQDESTVLDPINEGNPDEELAKLADEDDVLNSFEPNFNEDGLTNFLAKTNEVIYPVKIWQRAVLVDRNIDIEYDTDTTATGYMTKTFDATLFIAAFFEDPGDSLQQGTEPDSVYEKSFTTVVSRVIKYEKRTSFRNPLGSWKITSVSLPEGGTGSPNINITKMTLSRDGEDDIIVENPNEYLLSRNELENQIPVLIPFQEVTVNIELESAYPDTDYVTLTWGASKGRLQRSKKKLEMISENFDGQFYQREYEQYYEANSFPGYFHAIIQAVPFQVANDDATPVEKNSWGIPYIVR